MAEAPAAQPSAVECTHSEAVGTRWGDPISKERQAELKAVLDAWDAETDHGKRRGPFDLVPLTGADVFWLAERVRQPVRIASLPGAVPDLHLERADLRHTHLEGAILWEAHLEGAHLGQAHLERVRLDKAHLELAGLPMAHLEEAVLRDAHLEGAFALGAYLEGAILMEAHLEGVNLRAAQLDSHTSLSNVTLGEPRSLRARLLRRAPKWGNASLGDVRWEGPPDLTQVRWETLDRLGDEASIDWRTPAISATKLSQRDVVRAYRQVATQLAAQGLNEEADRFAERAQIRKRKQTFRQILEDWRRPWRLPRDVLRWLFSWFLAVLAGYGYHPGRSIFWYLATIAGFAYMYMQVSLGWVPFELPAPSQLAPLPWYEAVILSVSSFHGRGFFQPLQSLGDPVAALAAIEAVIGLFIEISFIATFTQRFFGAK